MKVKNKNHRSKFKVKKQNHRSKFTFMEVNKNSFYKSNFVLFMEVNELSWSSMSTPMKVKTTFMEVKFFFDGSK